MKNFIKISFALALTSMLFFSCSKDETINNTEKKVKITLSADKDRISTKTAAVEGETSASYIWTTEDARNIKLYTVSGGSLTEVQNPTINVASDKVLTISAEVTKGSYTFRAILCNSENAATQTPNGTSNYDPSADVLVSDDLAVEVGEGGATGNLNLKFHRKAVINKMTLKNMTAGEKVTKVVISSDKDLTGYLNNGELVGNGKTITLNYSNVAVPDGGQFPVYFVSMPNSGQTFTVEVTTDQNFYTKTFGPLNIIQGQFTRFGVSLPTPTEKTATIKFGSKGKQINGTNVTVTDSQGNAWTIKTVAGFIEFYNENGYSQIGDNEEEASKITFTTSLSKTALIKSMSIKISGSDNSSQFDVALNVGTTNIGGKQVKFDIIETVSSSSKESGTDLNISIDNIFSGVRVYQIDVTYVN